MSPRLAAWPPGCRLPGCSHTPDPSVHAVFAVLVAVCAFRVIRRRHRQEAQHKAGPPAALEKSGGPSSIIGAGDKFPGAGAAWAALQAPAQLRDAQSPPTYAVSLPPPSASTGAGQGDSFPGLHSWPALARSLALAHLAQPSSPPHLHLASRVTPCCPG